jgi:hypothetical protein
MTQPIDTIPVIDVDQAFPTLTTDATGRRSSSSRDANGAVTPAVEGALRDVLGWRPRAQDPAAFTAALSASFQLDDVEGHVVSTYRPRGFAMQADLGGVSGGQASLYTRAVAARTQMLLLLDGLVPLRPDADHEDCEAFRGLVRDALTAMVTELGTPGGPRVAVVDGVFRQLLGSSSRNIATISLTNADNVKGQLGAVRERFGLEDEFVNNADEEGIRTAFWTLVDLVTDIRRSWVNLRAQFTNRNQHGFLGTQLVLINQLLSAAAEQVDEVEAVLDSVLVSAAERQTIKVPRSQGLTLDGLLSWTRSFVTQDGPRIARDTGRDGIATSFTPTVVDIADAMGELMTGIGRPAIATTSTVQSFQAAMTKAARASKAPGFQATARLVGALSAPAPGHAVQLPFITLGAQRTMPAGMQATRTQIALSGLRSLLDKLANLAMRITRYPDAVLFDAIMLTSPSFPDALVSVRGLNLQETFVPVFRNPLVRAGDAALGVASVANQRPSPDRISYDGDTISAVFDAATFGQWLGAYDTLVGAKLVPPAPNLAAAAAGGQILAAADLPVKFIDGLTGKRVRRVQTRP